MKKKNILTIVVSVALVAVLAVGATLAYMSATDAKVTNTFKFGSMTVSLTEAQPTATGNETITANTKGYDYTNVVPGQTLNKAPKISVTSSVPAYVFVKVSGFDSVLSCGGITAGWTACADVDTLGNGTYYKTVSGSATAQDLGAIFSTVTVANVTDTTTATIPNIVIKVAAIQQSGFANAAAALAVATFQG